MACARARERINLWRSLQSICRRFVYFTPGRLIPRSCGSRNFSWEISSVAWWWRRRDELSSPQPRVAFFVIGSLYAGPCAAEREKYIRICTYIVFTARRAVIAHKTRRGLSNECGTIASANTRVVAAITSRRVTLDPRRDNFFRQADAAWFVLINKRPSLSVVSAICILFRET